MSTWFTADWHFGHANIIRYCRRPFPDVDSMDSGLVDAFNDRVAKTDFVWVLGDVAVPVSRLWLVGQMHGEKHLIPGNHDAVWRGSRRWSEARVQTYLDAGFARVVDKPDPIVIGEQRVELSHLPHEGDSGERERFGRWRPFDGGAWLLCGHAHHKWRQHRRQINVGVDAWAGQPVNVDQVAALIKVGAGEAASLRWPGYGTPLGEVDCDHCRPG